jgi:hypothetical protein
MSRSSGVLDDERIYSAAQVANDVLACDIGHVYDLIRLGKLRASNISTGRRPIWRIRHSALDAFLAENENQPPVVAAPVRPPVDKARDRAQDGGGGFAERYAARQAARSRGL